MLSPPWVAHGKLDLDGSEIEEKINPTLNHQEDLIRPGTADGCHDANRRSERSGLLDFDPIDSDGAVLTIAIADCDDRMRSLTRSRVRSECQTKRIAPPEFDASATNVHYKGF
jgi:hypothetical protein